MSYPQKRQRPVWGTGLQNRQQNYSTPNNTPQHCAAQTVADRVTSVVPIDATPNATRFPPYGREVSTAVLAGRVLNVAVFAGRDAWERARKRHGERGSASTMLLPHGEEAEAYC